MEYVKTNDLDVDNGFFHFTRIDNRQRINQVTPSSIAEAGMQCMQENPGQVSEGMRRTNNILERLEEKDNDKTLSEK